MNRADLHRLTEERLSDAHALLVGGRWSFAYYVAGYAVECGLKSCLLSRMIYTGWVFEEKAKIDECRTHDFQSLVKLAGLWDDLNNDLKDSAASSGEFAANWNRAQGWKVTDRYASKTEAEARDLYLAITAKPNGVLEWIKIRW